MTDVPSLFRLKFYLSKEASCPYISGQIERKLFTYLPNNTAFDTDINSTLTQSGFRRSHDVVYRPACAECNACIPVRVPVQLFTPNKTQRRIIRNNHDTLWQSSKNKATAEDFELFHHYQHNRHPDGDMAAMRWQDYQAMIEASSTESMLYRLRDTSGKLLAVMFCDRIDNGLSAIYSFYETTHIQKSLGTYSILSLILEAKRLGLDYLYLGYWIAKSDKMAYKSNFRPLEALGLHGWKPFIHSE